MSYKKQIETFLSLAAKAKKDPKKALEYIGKRLVFRYRKYSETALDFLLIPYENLTSIYSFFFSDNKLTSLFYYYNVKADKDSLLCVGFSKEENAYLYLKYHQPYNLFFTTPFVFYLARKKLALLNEKETIEINCSSDYRSNFFIKKIEEKSILNVNYIDISIEESYKLKAKALSSFVKHYSLYDVGLNKSVDLAVDKAMAVFSTSPTTGQLINDLQGKENISIYTSSHYHYQAFLKEDWAKLVKVKWLSRAYYKPNGDLEKDALKIIEAIKVGYVAYLNEKFKESFDVEVLATLSSALCLELEDRLLNRVIDTLSLKILAKNYDTCLIDGVCISDDVAFYKLVLKEIQPKKLLFIFPKRYSKLRVAKLINRLKEKTELYKKNNTILPTISLKQQIQERLATKAVDEQPVVLVSGNIDNENYAYSPTVFEILGVLNQQAIKTSFLPVKDITYFDEKGYINSFKNKGLISIDLINLYDDVDYIVTDELEASKIEATEYIIDYCIQNELVDINVLFYLKSEIDKVSNKVPSYISLLLNSIEILKKQNCIGFISALERNIVSRIVIAACQILGTKTVGIQGQIISTSKRYKKPVTNYFLVIDELQKDNHVKLGYNSNNIFLVGSANYRNSFKKLATRRGDSIEPVAILILQHSMIDIMLDLFKTTFDICHRLDVHLYIKPHPHQEAILINDISAYINSQATNQKTVLLDKNDNTYCYIAKSNIVIGLFSSALLESLLMNKDVIVYAKNEIDPSIDFSEGRWCKSNYPTRIRKCYYPAIRPAEQSDNKSRNKKTLYSQ